MNYRFAESEALLSESVDRVHIGVIAQQVEPLFPELVTRQANGKLAVAYLELGVVAIKAVQEQQDIIRSQTAQIEALKEENTQLNARQDQQQELISLLMQRMAKLEQGKH